MAITAAMVKELRESTGAGMMDAKKALTENDGDMRGRRRLAAHRGLSQSRQEIRPRCRRRSGRRVGQ